MRKIPSPEKKLKEMIRNGEREEAIKLLEDLYDGYLATHDRLVDYCNLLLTFISLKYGEEQVKEAWESIIHTFHRKSLKRLRDVNHEQRVEILLKEHLQHGGEVSLEEYPDRTIILLHCCGSGGRIRRQGRTDLHPASAVPGGTTQGKYAWAFGKTRIPYYCTHCSIISDEIGRGEIGFRLEIRYGEQFDVEGNQVGPPCQFILYKDQKQGREKDKIERRR